jgi:hypothetical protein
MSLFGARKTSTFSRLKERPDKKMAEESTGESNASSSGIRALLNTKLDMITGRLATDSEGVATKLEITHELSELDREDQMKLFHGSQEDESLRAGEEQDTIEIGRHQARIEDDLRRCENSQRTPRQESRSLPSDLEDMRAYSDLTGKTGVTGVTRHRSRSVGSTGSELSSLPPSTVYGGSILAMPQSTISQDPFSTPRASTGIIARRCIPSGENTSQNATEQEKEGGMEETRKVCTTSSRKFEISDSSDNEDDAMT